MKTIKMTLLALVVAFVISCGKDSENEVTPVDIKAGLVGKIWRFATISGKVNNSSTIKEEVTVFKDGKNQYAFNSDLSQETYQFDQDGKAWINSEEFEWELSSDNKIIQIGEKGEEKDLKLEVISLSGNDLKISQKGWTEVVSDKALTNSVVVNMDVTISMSGQVIDPAFLTVKSKLGGKTWKLSNVTGKVIGGKVAGDIAIFKNGKNQYGFDQDLSKATYVFKENGDVEIGVAYASNTQTTLLKWGVSGDNRRVKMWRVTDPSWILTNWEIKSVTDTEIKVFEKAFHLGVTDKTLTDSFSVKVDAVLTLIVK
jgi:DNA-binding beta-propeller fold protein YncE